jgi:hypothetical protein
MSRLTIPRLITPVLLATGLVTGIAFYCFGNFSGIAAFLGGHELVLVSDSPSEADNSVRVRICNLTKKDVRIVGARSSCSCLKLDCVPDVVPAFSEVESLALFDSSSKEQGPDIVTITLFTSASGTPVLTTQCCNPAARR